jgi:hypothetical protein
MRLSEGSGKRLRTWLARAVVDRFSGTGGPQDDRRHQESDQQHTCDGEKPNPPVEHGNHLSCGGSGRIRAPLFGNTGVQSKVDAMIGVEVTGTRLGV